MYVWFYGLAYVWFYVFMVLWAPAGPPSQQDLSCVIPTGPRLYCVEPNRTKDFMLDPTGPTIKNSPTGPIPRTPHRTNLYKNKD